MAKAKLRKKIVTTASMREKERAEGNEKVFVLGATPKLLKGKKSACMLVDAEILNYHVVNRNLEEIYDRNRDVYTWEVNRTNARVDFKERILSLAAWMKADRIIMAWGGGSCFRRSILGTYKLHRQQIKKPLGYWELAQWSKEQGDWESIQWSRLEADDVLGIFATDPEIYKAHTPVIVSDDKDLKTIPGLHLTFRSLEGNDKTQGMFNVSPEEAERFHLVQTLTGDQGDGYFGLSGIGPVKAEKIITGIGTNAETREVLPALSIWQRIVWSYENEQQKEKDALMNAQCAYILHNKDYNRKTGAIKLWQPSAYMKRRPKINKKK